MHDPHTVLQYHFYGPHNVCNYGIIHYSNFVASPLCTHQDKMDDGKHNSRLRALLDQEGVTYLTAHYHSVYKNPPKILARQGQWSSYSCLSTSYLMLILHISGLDLLPWPGFTIAIQDPLSACNKFILPCMQRGMDFRGRRGLQG